MTDKLYPAGDPGDPVAADYVDQVDHDGDYVDTLTVTRHAASPGYLYTIVCCGWDIDIWQDRESQCPGCKTAFIAVTPGGPGTCEYPDCAGVAVRDVDGHPLCYVHADAEEAALKYGKERY